MIQETSLALLISTAGIAVALIVLLRLRQRALSQGRSTTVLTGLVLAAPVALLTVIGGLAIVTALDLNHPASARTNALLVEAAAQGCRWRFDYVQSGVRTEELVLPVGRAVRIDLTSLDSVHSFSVPGLSLTGEAQAQRWTTLALTPKEIDDYPLDSEEACAGQAGGWVRVVEPMAFQSWLAEQPPSPRPTLVVSPAERGQQLAET
ncbi:MAG TPA: hypothetical protein VFF68_07400, partial [Anaerolineaceae bacterium]|nr:hypothetical protein [Anaerolineaceae bacterium]